MYTPSRNTPNLDYNLKKLYGRNRVKWDKKINFTLYKDLREFIIEDTFLTNIPNVICAVARLISNTKIELSIYRFDNEDLINEGNPINLDQYIIEEQIQERIDFYTITKSTEFNQNMKNTINSNDLYIKLKEDKISDHHSKDLPLEVKKILDVYKVRYQQLVKKGLIKQV